MPLYSVVNLDELDKKLIVFLQEDFPLVLRPFQALARRLSASEDEIIRRVRRLKERGIIKRIGSVHNPQNIGYRRRALVGMLAPPDKLKKTVDIVNSFAEVTHNYLRRDDSFNLWFTLICPTQKRIDDIIRQIRCKSGIKKLISLPTIRTIKIKTVFKP